MAPKAGKTLKIVVPTLIGVGFASLVLAYYVVGSPDDAGAHGVPAEQSSGIQGGATVEPASATGTRQASGQATGTDNTAAQSGPPLNEAELERLRDVFQNSLSPLFQDGLQLDQEGRSAIDVFVASMPSGLGDDELDRVSAMITDQRSSPDAEDLAFVITHLYRLEQEEARLTNDSGPVTTMAEQLEARERISELRDEWFGQELSKLLFSSSADGETNPGDGETANRAEDGGADELPDEQVRNREELATMEHGWEQRYEQFESEKRLIDRAGLDQKEKDRQIEALFRQHYKPRELEAARAFDQCRDGQCPE